MKRSYHDFRNRHACRNVQSNNSTQIAPIFIEVDDDNTRRNKRPRKNDALLNLLIRAITVEKIHSKDEAGVDAKIIYGNSVLIDDSTAASIIISSTGSSSNSNDTDSNAAKQIVDRVPLDDRSLSITVNDECASSMASFSDLPNGRPLMAPPRLPTHFIPGQVQFICTKLMSTETTLSCEVRYAKTAPKRYKKTPFSFPLFSD